MPSPHPRIAVVLDHELDSALRGSDALLSPAEKRSQAARVRALALRGARALAEQGEAAASTDAALAAMGAVRATAAWSTLDAPLRLPAAAGLRPGTAALEDARGSR